MKNYFSNKVRFNTGGRSNNPSTGGGGTRTADDAGKRVLRPELRSRWIQGDIKVKRKEITDFEDPSKMLVVYMEATGEPTETLNEKGEKVLTYNFEDSLGIPGGGSVGFGYEYDPNRPTRLDMMQMLRDSAQEVIPKRDLITPLPTPDPKFETTIKIPKIKIPPIPFKTTREKTPWRGYVPVSMGVGAEGSPFKNQLLNNSALDDLQYYLDLRMSDSRTGSLSQDDLNSAYDSLGEILGQQALEELGDDGLEMLDEMENTDDPARKRELEIKLKQRLGDMGYAYVQGNQENVDSQMQANKAQLIGNQGLGYNERFELARFANRMDRLSPEEQKRLRTLSASTGMIQKQATAAKKGSPQGLGLTTLSERTTEHSDGRTNTSTGVTNTGLPNQRKKGGRITFKQGGKILSNLITNYVNKRKV